MECDMRTSPYKQSQCVSERPRNMSVSLPSLALAWQTKWTMTHSCRWSDWTWSELPSQWPEAMGQHGRLAPVSNNARCNLTSRVVELTH